MALCDNKNLVSRSAFNKLELKPLLEYLSCRKRKLSLEMIRQIHDSLNIPTEVLIQAY